MATSNGGRKGFHRIKRHLEQRKTVLTDGELRFLRKQTAHAVSYAKNAHREHGTYGLLARLAMYGFGLLFAFMGALFLWIAFQPIPSIQSFESRKISNSTTIYDRTGKVVLYDVVGAAERTPVTSEEISQNIKDAVIAIEDDQFYSHHGIRYDSTFRAIVNSLLAKLGFPVKVSGGSTITQQVVKNTLLTSDRSPTRKLKEWFLALRLEKKYNKDQILTIYLNEIPYGGNLYGLQSASKQFFGVTADKLTVAQSAYLASIPNAPTRLSPYGKNVAELEKRKDLVLRKMRDLSMITEDEYARSRSEKVVFLPKQDTASKAIHFVEYVKQEVESRYGEDAMTGGGFDVITTLDWDIQKKAEEYAKARALENEKNYNASNTGVVVVDPTNGDILAMVGSRDYSDPLIDGKYNVATAKRQPGSSFKPIVYAAGFEMGYLPETKLMDVQTQFGSNCEHTNMTTTNDGKCYAPDNYDGRYVGPIALRDALGQSRNVPAVKLLYLVTPTRALRLAQTLGIQTLGKIGQYGLTLVLGGGEVRLLDMVGAYGAFANDGLYAQPNAVLRVKDKEGNTSYEYQSNNTRVLTAKAVRYLNSVLSDNVARTPLFGSRSFMYFGDDKPVAVKSGTTNNNKDAWMIGYTSRVVVGVWFGNNDNTPMKKGSSIAGPLWRDVMNVAMSKKGYAPFPAPAPVDTSIPPILQGYWYGNESFTIDSVSGKLATDKTPPETRKQIVLPNPRTILHFVTPGNPFSAPSNPESNAQYKAWDYSVSNWVEKNKSLIPDLVVAPTEYDDVHVPENQPVVTIKNQSDIGQLTVGKEYQIQYTVQAKRSIKTIQLLINNVIVGEFDDIGVLSFTPASDYTGKALISIVAVDKDFNRGNASVNSVISE